ncbi:MAG: cell division protein FtsA [Chloroflexi bacterium]|nr:cell division protein FtsA [Chloroflexota bacterium]
MERTIVGIDIGTTKICTLVGQVDNQGVMRVIGVGVVPSRGLRKGGIVDLEAVTRAIGQSVQKAEQVSGYAINEAYIGVGGSHIASQNSRGVAAIGRGDRPVDRDDVERAMENAQAIALPHNRRVIHCLPRGFILDGQDGIKNPLGLMGYRLEVEVHIITGAMSAIQNLIQCVEGNRISPIDLVVQPLASSEAVLTEEERTMGVALVDLGGGTIDMAIHIDQSVWETLVRRVGGNHITLDIAKGLRTPFATAEDIKIRYAHAIPSMVNEREVIEIAGFGDKSLYTISRRELCDIVAMRVEEMIEIIGQEIRRSGFDGLLPAGLVLTGGTANLRGLRELAEQRLQMPVRIGMPRKLYGLVEAINSPAYATAVGLLLWGMQQETEGREGMYGGEKTGIERALEWFKNLLP